IRRPARIDHQSRRQPQARNPDRPARGSRRGPRARLRQSGRQADDDADARYRGFVARVDGSVPGVVRSRAGVRRRGDTAQPDGGSLPIPKLTLPAVPQGETGAVREAAKMLVSAERPLIRPGKLARTPAGWDLLVHLAELLQAPVDVGTYGSWQDFPSWHALYG